jgi:hypothetical protein
VTVAPDVPAAVIGWRRWRLEKGLRAPTLVSPITSSRWRARVEKSASCRFGGHDAPAPGCGCGLYAVAALSPLLRAFSPGEVLGCTALWGTIIEGEDGWRGATGYPVVLFTESSVDERTRRRLEASYGVPVHALPATLEALVAVRRAPLERLAVDVRDSAARPRSALEPDLPAAPIAALLAEMTDAAVDARAREDATAVMWGRSVPP